MNKTLRIILGVVILVALVAIGLGGTAWADKLSAGSQIQAKEGGKIYSPSRPLGTVSGGSTINGPATATVGLFTVVIPDNTIVQLLTVLPSGISAPAGKTLVPGSLMEFTLSNGTGNTPADISFTYPGLVSGQTIAYWNGSAWVNLTPDGNGNYTIPAGMATPVYLATFSA